MSNKDKKKARDLTLTHVVVTTREFFTLLNPKDDDLALTEKSVTEEEHYQ